MNISKKIILSAAFIAVLSLTGCYTVVWSPDEQFPTKENSDNQDYGYYNDSYYGDYYNYYDAPWWYKINPPGFYNNQPSYYRDTSAGMTNLRNDNGGRGNGTTLIVPQSPPSARNGNTSGSNSNSTDTKRTGDNNSRNTSGSNSNDNNSRTGNSNSNNNHSNNDRNSNGRN